MPFKNFMTFSEILRRWSNFACPASPLGLHGEAGHASERENGVQRRGARQGAWCVAAAGRFQAASAEPRQAHSATARSWQTRIRPGCRWLTGLNFFFKGRASQPLLPRGLSPTGPAIPVQPALSCTRSRTGSCG